MLYLQSVRDVQLVLCRMARCVVDCARLEALSLRGTQAAALACHHAAMPALRVRLPAGALLPLTI